MKKEERRYQARMTLLVAIFVFLILLISIVLSAGLIYVLLHSGVIASEEELLTLDRELLLMALISLILGTGLTFALSRISIRPIGRIVRQMKKLASGDFKARLSFGKRLDAHPIFAEITGNFNKMAQELDNTEILRGDFINNFSHEFKTPIVSIAGFAKLLKRGNLTDAQRAEYLDIIEEESLRLAAMATNVLDLTRYESQTILKDLTTFNLSEQLRGCILELETKWERKKIEFDLLFREHTICGNKGMLRHVWINLLDNAIKFSPEYECIQVGIEEDASAVSVWVLNHGSEIPPEQQERIFDKFYQADESHGSQGNGLGLALVKQVVELHGGSIRVQSENGTTVFTAVFPKIREKKEKAEPGKRKAENGKRKAENSRRPASEEERGGPGGENPF